MESLDDVAIIGAGPAGLAAAIYTGREEMTTTVYEGDVVGGWAALTGTIENYPGFPDGVGGVELSDKLEAQATKYGAKVKTGTMILGLKQGPHGIELATSTGTKHAKAVLITTGSDYKRLGVPGEAEFTSKGVHYCATCDGPLYRGKDLIVVGGGDSAMQEGLFLTKFASHITMLVRGEKLKGSQLLIDRVSAASDKITVQYNTAIERVLDNGKMATGVMTNQGEIKADGIFVFIGQVPNTHWLKDTIELDERGFIHTDDNFQTNIGGVFAAGDVRAGAIGQIASAVGEGVSAAIAIREFISGHLPIRA
ncbi:MAG TPA: FAD-dependent oxidoreductase [Candidatus Saccharimonadales bacterium]|nr:FAD-dependent oxidoreductase [Candidatus Saccharimonadales bacterium]